MQFTIIESADALNDRQKMRPVEFLANHWKSHKGKHVTLWGLSFKPRTDDVREAPAQYIAAALLKAGARVTAFDPVATESFKRAFPDKRIRYAESALEAAEGADALIVCTEWDEFRTIESADLARVMKGSIIVDGRNIFDRKEMEAEKFTYFGIGV